MVVHLHTQKLVEIKEMVLLADDARNLTSKIVKDSFAESIGFINNVTSELSVTGKMLRNSLLYQKKMCNEYTLLLVRYTAYHIS